jgi:hypothetical protein
MQWVRTCRRQRLVEETFVSYAHDATHSVAFTTVPVVLLSVVRKMQYREELEIEPSTIPLLLRGVPVKYI